MLGEKTLDLITSSWSLEAILVLSLYSSSYSLSRLSLVIGETAWRIPTDVLPRDESEIVRALGLSNIEPHAQSEKMCIFSFRAILYLRNFPNFFLL